MACLLDGRLEHHVHRRPHVERAARRAPPQPPSMQTPRLRTLSLQSPGGAGQVGGGGLRHCARLGRPCAPRAAADSLDADPLTSNPLTSDPPDANSLDPNSLPVPDGPDSPDSNPLLIQALSPCPYHCPARRGRRAPRASAPPLLRAVFLRRRREGEPARACGPPRAGPSDA